MLKTFLLKTRVLLDNIESFVIFISSDNFLPATLPVKYELLHYCKFLFYLEKERLICKSTYKSISWSRSFLSSFIDCCEIYGEIGNFSGFLQQDIFGEPIMDYRTFFLRNLFLKEIPWTCLVWTLHFVTMQYWNFKTWVCFW